MSAGDVPPSELPRDDAENLRRSRWPLLAFLAPLALALISVVALRSRPVVPTQPVDGRAEYARCQACHGVDGSGIAGYAPALEKSPVISGPAEALIQRILVGSFLGNEVRPSAWSAVMPSFAAQFDDAEVAAVAQWLVTTWGDNPTTPTKKITTEAVAQQRARLVTGARP